MPLGDYLRDQSLGAPITPASTGSSSVNRNKGIAGRVFTFRGNKERAIEAVIREQGALDAPARAGREGGRFLARHFSYRE